MNNSEDKKKDIIETPEELTQEESTEEMLPEKQELEPLTLEDLELDVSEPSVTFTATLHFEFSDIFNAIEHIETEPEPEVAEESVEVEPEEALATDEEPAEAGDVVEPEIVEETETSEAEPKIEPEPDSETTDPQPAAPKQNLIARLRGQDKGTKKLVVTDIILLAVVLISIIVGLVIANSLVNNAKEANEAKIAEMQANIKEVKLAENLYNMAANKVVDDIAVPTYSLDQLYALDLREKTGFTAKDLKMITRKGLVGCEEAFVKAEETYGVNSIFLISIASLESAYGTMMFRPNNMFGYGRTGFSSKEECIMTVAKGLGTRYLPPGGSLYGGSPTLKGVNKRYAANPQWYYKVGKYMQGYYAELAAAKNGALDKFE